MATEKSNDMAPVLEFLNRRARAWLGYMGFCAVQTLLALLLLAGTMMGILASDPRWSPVMVAVPLLVFHLLRPGARRRERRLVEEYRAQRGAGGKRPEPSDCAKPRSGRLRRLGREGLVLLPFLLAAAGLTWGAPVPLRWFALVSAYTVGWGFARGSLVPLFSLLHTERVLSAAAAGPAARGDSISQQVP